MDPAQPTSSEATQSERLLHHSRFSKGEDSPAAVAVIGGGLAGLASACALAESGFRVTLF